MMRLWFVWILFDLELFNNYFVMKKLVVVEDILLKEFVILCKWFSVILFFLCCLVRIVILWGWLGKCRVVYLDWCSCYGKYFFLIEIGIWYFWDVFWVWDFYLDGFKYVCGYSLINSWMILYKFDNKVGVIYIMWGCRFDGYLIEIFCGVV